MKTIKYITPLFMALLFMVFTSQAQETLLSKKPYNYEDPIQFGQNRTYFIHFYTGYGWILPVEQNTGSEINLGKSFNFEGGLRFKYKLTNWLAVGSTFSYNLMNYSIKQNANKNFGKSLTYDKQKLITQGFNFNPYLRINIGKRGNVIGKYLDLGYSFEWMGNRLNSKGNMNGLSKTVQKDLRTVSNQSQGIYVGIGIKRYSIFGKYRLSELIESSYAPELPPYTVGIQIGFF